MSTTVTSEGIEQLIADTVRLCAAPAGLAPACQTTLPLKASTTRMPRPLVRLVTVALPVGLLIVQVPFALYVTVPEPTGFTVTDVALEDCTKQRVISSTVSS